MSKHLAKILRKTNHVFLHQDVPLFSVAYLSDFNLKTSDALHAKLVQSLETHLDQYSLKELSHLAIHLSAQENLKENKSLINSVKERIVSLKDQSEAIDQATAERLAIFDADFVLDEAQTHGFLTSSE